MPTLGLVTDQTLAFEAVVYDSNGQVSDPKPASVVAYLRGDANHDNSVNVSDLQALAQAWGTQASGLAEDFNGDGYVNVGDLQGLISSWNRSLH